MLYLLLKPYINQYHIANLFHYISFRSIISIIFSFVFCIGFGRKLINYLIFLKTGQPIRDCGPESHLSKAGTPTMGGLMIIFSVLLSCLLFSDLSNGYVLITLIVLIGFSLIGFADDFKKVVKKDHHGISGKTKLFSQALISIPACIVISYLASKHDPNILTIPFLKSLTINLGYFYIPFAVIVIIGSSNAVNLTDGLDGLAIVPIALVSSCIGIIAYLSGNVIYSEYLQITHIPGSAELTVFCCSLIGASMGFLWFNCQPAEVFMGDTGSLALGGVLGTLSVIIKQEILLAITGGLFVLETLSVIIQVYYFKMTGGKRVFKMAPIHHHFEKSGWSESKVVIRFWIIAVIFALIGLSSLKLR